MKRNKDRGRESENWTEINKWGEEEEDRGREMKRSGKNKREKGGRVVRLLIEQKKEK